MSIQDRITKWKPYFSDFRMNASIAAVDMNIPNKWDVDVKYLKANFDVDCDDKLNDPGHKLFCISLNEENNIEQLYDCIDFVIERQREIEFRVKLLKQKESELLKLFETESLEKLKVMTFAFPGFEDEDSEEVIENENNNNTEEDIKSDVMNVVDETANTESEPKKKNKKNNKLTSGIKLGLKSLKSESAEESDNMKFIKEEVVG